ncbi:hypothetical protein MRX96_039041 [Rhipicephalus microplus]
MASVDCHTDFSAFVIPVVVVVRDATNVVSPCGRFSRPRHIGWYGEWRGHHVHGLQRRRCAKENVALRETPPW